MHSSGPGFGRLPHQWWSHIPRMGRCLLIATLLCAVSVAQGSRIFFPEDRPGRCVTTDGRLGECVSASARRCALYPTIGHLLTARPKVCNFIANDPVICCPPEHVLPDTLGQEPAVAAAPAPTPETATEVVETSAPQEATQPASEAPQPNVVQPEDTKSEGISEPEEAQPGETPAQTESPEATTAASASTEATPDVDELLGRFSECGVKQPQVAFLLPNNTYRFTSTEDGSGQEVRLGRHPWAALVGLKTEEGAVGWICGGALVSDRLVVTAAHCAVLGGSPDRLAVRLGENDLRTATDGDTVERGVSAIRRHPQYGPPAQRHDLALLLLDESATPSDRVQPVCLPPPAPAHAPELTLEGNQLRLPAFDLSGDLTGSDPAGRGKLSSPFARISPLRACAEPLEELPHAGFIFPQGLRTDTELCVLPASGDVCVHDSGGPVVLEADDGSPATLLGLRLLGGCQEGQPEVTLRIDHYVEFIRESEREMLEFEKTEAGEGSGESAVDEGSGDPATEAGSGDQP